MYRDFMKGNNDEDDYLDDYLRDDSIEVEEDLEEKYVKEMQKTYNDYKDDTEYLHIKYDDYLLRFLEEKGFNKIVKQFEDIDDEVRFWYS